MILQPPPIFFFFFNDTATTEIYTLSLHDALPIFEQDARSIRRRAYSRSILCRSAGSGRRSEEHTSELSRLHLVCRLLLEKKKKTKKEPEHDIDNDVENQTTNHSRVSC